jgi:hypothetical protein
MTYVSTSEVQQIEIDGDPAGGTFTLGFKGQTTTPLPFNCTPDQMEAALVALSTIGPNNVSVSLGKQSYVNDDTQTASTDFPGVWLVTFQGMFTSGASPQPPPLLTPTSSISGINVIVAETSHWVDTGHVETVSAVIPVGSPTPMVAGAAVACVFFLGLGYGVIACECRDFAPAYY